MKKTQKTRSTKARNAARPPQNAFKEAVESAVRCVEMAILSEALHRHGGNRRAVSRELGMPYRTLLYKIDQHGIDIPTPTYSPKTGKGTRSNPRKPKIDPSKLLPSPTERRIIETKNNTPPSTGEGDNHNPL